MRHRKRREDDPYGYDTDAINALAFVEGGGSLSTVERFLTSAHQQVSAILREAKSHREFARRANEAISLYIVEKKTADEARAAAEEKKGRRPKRIDWLMVSDRQLSANRKNARLSSGPRTLAGKLRSRSNALRHGLATPIGGRLDIAQAIDGLAKLLCGSSNSFSRNEHARAAAECHFELQRIRSARAEVLRRIGDLE